MKKRLLSLLLALVMLVGMIPMNSLTAYATELTEAEQTASTEAEEIIEEESVLLAAASEEVTLLAITDVPFTSDSKAVSGSSVTVDLDALAEQDEAFMDAYFNNGDIIVTWYLNGTKVTTNIGGSFGEVIYLTDADIGKSLYVTIEADGNTYASKMFTVETPPDVYVGGVCMGYGEYLAVGATETQTTKPSGGYAYFKDGTLTLHNYQYEGEGYSFKNSVGAVFGAAVYSGTALNVTFEGENTLNQTTPLYSIYSQDDLFITGDGSLHITQEIACQSGDLWIDSGTIHTDDPNVCVTATNGSVAVSGGNVNCSIYACFDIEIAGGVVNAASYCAALDAGRDITIYGGTVTAKTIPFFTHEDYHAIEFDGTFTVMPSLVVHASVDPDGEPGTYTAAEHDTYDLIVIEAPVFTKQPAGGKAPANKTLTVTWKTNFQPLRVEVYYLSLRDQEILVDTLPGTATSVELPPRIEHYYIISWYNDSAPVTSEMFEIAEAECVTVFFRSGETMIEEQAVEIGQCAVEPASPEQEGVTFLGWYTEDGELYDFSIPVTENINLYAKFGHSVNFWFMGDEYPIFGVGVEHGACVNEPAEPGQEGVTFLGWHTADGELYDFDAPVTKDINLYAKFGHSVNFWFMGDEYPIFGVGVEHGACVNEPAEPGQEGKVFLGWYTEDDKLYDFSTPVTKDINLYAKFKDAAALEAPAIKVANVASSGKPKITWNKVDGATKYKVYRSTDGGKNYSLLSTTSGTSLTNTSTTAGNKYYYYVIAVNANGVESTKSNVVSRVCDLPAPTVKISVVSSTGKLKLTWNKIDGAKNYSVYRSTDGGATYSLLKTTTGTSLTNTSATAGNMYYYKVKANHTNSSATSAYSSVVKGTCDLPAPTVKISVVSSTGKLKLTWNKIDGAKSYSVYRSTDGGETYSLLKTTTGTSLTNTSATAGNMYYYKVKANHTNSSANSAYSAVVKGTCDLPRPTASVALNSSGKPVVTWEKVSGATKYTVYIYDADGNLLKTSSTTGTKLTHSSAVKGTTYSYRVVAVHSNSAANSAKSTAVSIKCTK